MSSECLHARHPWLRQQGTASQDLAVGVHEADSLMRFAQCVKTFFRALILRQIGLGGERVGVELFFRQLALRDEIALAPNRP